MGAGRSVVWSPGIVFVLLLLRATAAAAQTDAARPGEAMAFIRVVADVRVDFDGVRAPVERKGLEQAEEDYRIVKERFESGRGIQLEILDAQVSLTRARFNAVSALAEYNSALAMWLRATGRVR